MRRTRTGWVVLGAGTAALLLTCGLTGRGQDKGAKGGNAPSSTQRSASLRNRPLSKMLLVNSSTNSGTPSVRSAI